jgi:hypothetical protein
MSEKRSSQWMRGAVAAVGLALLTTGAVATVAGSAAGGSVALVLAGGTLLVGPFLADRLEELSLGTQGLSFKLSRTMVELGAPQVAGQLEDTGLTEYAQAYGVIHEELDGKDEYRGAKIYLQDLLVMRAQRLAVRESLDPREVRRLFFRGAPVLRVLVLGLMKGNPLLADTRVIISAITESRTANEQYHGLQLAQQRWTQMTRTDRQLVQEAIRLDRSKRPDVWLHSSDRPTVADRLLRLPLDDTDFDEP